MGPRGHFELNRVAVPRGDFTVFSGPNHCGMRALQLLRAQR
jgi:hypothetical protein